MWRYGWTSRGQITADLEPDVTEGRAEMWVLVGRRYLDVYDRRGWTLCHVLNGLYTTVYYPFGQTKGIGEQQQWLDRGVVTGEPVCCSTCSRLGSGPRPGMRPMTPDSRFKYHREQ